MHERVSVAMQCVHGSRVQPSACSSKVHACMPPCLIASSPRSSRGTRQRAQPTELTAHTLQAPGGHRLSYGAAQALFKRDPPRSWAAYVAGALVVLQREKGARFEDGLSILVASGELIVSIAARDMVDWIAAHQPGHVLRGGGLALLV